MGRKRILMTVLIVLAVITTAVVGVRGVLEANLNRLAVSAIAEVELSKLGDGVYKGGCKAFPIAVEVEVEVAGHVIKDIRLIRHDNGQGKPAEVLTERVVEAQSLKVDTVAGATYSSKAILKAIETALSGVE